MAPPSLTPDKGLTTRKPAHEWAATPGSFDKDRLRLNQRLAAGLGALFVARCRRRQRAGK